MYLSILSFFILCDGVSVLLRIRFATRSQINHIIFMVIILQDLVYCYKKALNIENM